MSALLPREFLGGRIRRLHPGDLAAFQAYRAVPGLGRFQGWSPMAESAALAFLEEMNTAPLFVPGAWIQLGIEAPPNGPLVGDIGLFLAADGRHAEIGFTLAPAAQGRGIATAAVAEAVRLVFVATGARRVFGITDSRNRPSARLLERVGFRRQEDRSAVFRGEPCTEQVYALSREQG
jgi:aminoglycoside 6'-N-acetyltransferase